VRGRSLAELGRECTKLTPDILGNCSSDLIFFRIIRQIKIPEGEIKVPEFLLVSALRNTSWANDLYSVDEDEQLVNISGQTDRMYNFFRLLERCLHFSKSHRRDAFTRERGVFVTLRTFFNENGEEKLGLGFTLNWFPSGNLDIFQEWLVDLNLWVLDRIYHPPRE
jgi:hypothetical protein